MKSHLNYFGRHVAHSLILVFLIATIGITGINVFLWSATVEAQSAQAVLHRDDPKVRAAIAVQNRHAETLMGISEVVGTGVGIGTDGLPVIKVFTVREGIPGIPGWLESIPVQVEATGMIVALGDTVGRYRPAPIGVSTGHPDITAGTIGARVTDGTNVYALSNNHVYANSNNAGLGDSALQPGPYDGGTDTDFYRIGTLYDFEPINFSGGDNYIDAAIAISSPENLSNSTWLDDGYGVPNSEIRSASLNLPVKKYGRTTGMTHGNISEINLTVSICYETLGVFCLKSARFVDQIGISPGTFSAGGDSGSLIVTEDGNYPVGLLFAGSSTRTIANPIGFVLSRFNVAIDGGAEPPPTTPPDMPSNLTAEVVSSNQINLAWIDNAIDEDGFRIERCQGLGCTNFAQIATVGANTTSYSDTGLSASTTYAYRVLAFNAAGDSEYSNYAEATTLDAPALPPGAPSNLAAKAVSSSQINLTWIDNANNEDGFEIQRCTGSKCTDFATITTVGPNVTSYSNTGLSRSTTYRYRVRAYNTSGDSAYSNIAKATTRR